MEMKWEILQELKKLKCLDIWDYKVFKEIYTNYVLLCKLD